MSKHVLAVDDSRTIRNMVRFTLEENGFQVTEAEDGKDALGKLENISPDIIITDLNMPVMDGFELIEQLRGMEKYKYLPILILTTESGDDKKQRGREVGATGWIVKPFNPEKLIQVVGKVCM